MLLRDLLEEYTLAARAANRSPKTIETYGWQVQRFQRFLDRQGYSADCDTLTTRTLREYIAELQTSYAAQTITNNVIGLKTLFGWGLSEELLTHDPTLRVDVPKVPQTDYAVLVPDEVDTLLRSCDTKMLLGSRDFAIVMLLFDGGIRASELITITDAAVDWQRGLIRVSGKGAKERQIAVSARTLRAIKRYMLRRSQAGHEHVPYLFLNRNGVGLTRSGLFQLLERLGERCGLKVYPHKLRHTFAVEALRNQAREFDIQTQLGHNSLYTTKLYARQAAVHLKEQHERFSPADRLKVRV